MAGCDSLYLLMVYMYLGQYGGQFCCSVNFKVSVLSVNPKSGHQLLIPLATLLLLVYAVVFLSTFLLTVGVITPTVCF